MLRLKQLARPLPGRLLVTTSGNPPNPPPPPPSPPGAPPKLSSLTLPHPAAGLGHSQIPSTSVTPPRPSLPLQPPPPPPPALLGGPGLPPRPHFFTTAIKVIPTVPMSAVPPTMMAKHPLASQTSAPSAAAAAGMASGGRGGFSALPPRHARGDRLPVVPDGFNVPVEVGRASWPPGDLMGPAVMEKVAVSTRGDPETAAERAIALAVEAGVGTPRAATVLAMALVASLEYEPVGGLASLPKQVAMAQLICLKAKAHPALRVPPLALPRLCAALMRCFHVLAHQSTSKGVIVTPGSSPELAEVLALWREVASLVDVGGGIASLSPYDRVALAAVPLRMGAPDEALPVLLGRDLQLLFKGIGKFTQRRVRDLCRLLALHVAKRDGALPEASLGALFDGTVSGSTPAFGASQRAAAVSEVADVISNLSALHALAADPQIGIDVPVEAWDYVIRLCIRLDGFAGALAAVEFLGRVSPGTQAKGGLKTFDDGLSFSPEAAAHLSSHNGSTACLTGYKELLVRGAPLSERIVHNVLMNCMQNDLNIEGLEILCPLLSAYPGSVPGTAYTLVAVIAQRVNYENLAQRMLVIGHQRALETNEIPAFARSLLAHLERHPENEVPHLLGLLASIFKSANSDFQAVFMAELSKEIKMTLERSRGVVSGVESKRTRSLSLIPMEMLRRGHACPVDVWGNLIKLNADFKNPLGVETLHRAMAKGGIIPDFETAYNISGCLLELNRLDDAADILLRAMDSEPDSSRTLRTHMLLARIMAAQQNWPVVEALFDELRLMKLIDDPVARTFLVICKTYRRWESANTITNTLEEIAPISSFGYYLALSSARETDDIVDYVISPAHAKLNVRLATAYPAQMLRVGGLSAFLASMDDLDARCPEAVGEAFLFAIDIFVKKRHFQLVYEMMDILRGKFPALLPRALAKVLGHLVMHTNFESIAPVVRRYSVGESEFKRLLKEIREGDAFTGAPKTMLMRLAATLSTFFPSITLPETYFLNLTRNQRHARSVFEIPVKSAIAQGPGPAASSDIDFSLLHEQSDFEGGDIEVADEALLPQEEEDVAATARANSKGKKKR